MNPVASSEVRARKSVTDSVADFLVGLHELHNRKGRPSKSEMAKKAGRPLAMFAFLDATALPTWDEVSTFLVAVEQRPTVIEKFRNTHKRLEQQQKGDQADATVRAEAASSVAGQLVVNLDRSEFLALTDVKAARTPKEFAAALNRLRSTARIVGKDEPLSYKDMEKASGKRLSKSNAQRLATADKMPTKATHVEEYVRACGATDEHVRLWLTEYQRLKRGALPIVAQHAVTARTTDDGAWSGARSEGLLAGLTDTSAFTAEQLGLDGRKLILFVTAAMVDDTGSAETTYRAILRRWGSMPDHWAFGRDLGQLDQLMVQYVGRTARMVPLWPMIHDVIEVAIREPIVRASVLADAAGLYNQVTDEHPPGYAGIVHLPWWGYPITGHTQLETVLSSLPQAGRRLTDAELEVIELREDRFHYRQALDTAIRAFRKVVAREDDVARRKAQLATYEEQLVEWEKRLAQREAQLVVREALTASPMAEIPGPPAWSLRQAAGN